MKIIAIFIVIAAFLAGCVASPQERRTLAGQVPADYRNQITEYFRATLKDPDSVKDAMISQPTTAFVGLVNGGNVPAVCVRLNAKNSYGGYTGIETNAVTFRGGVITGMTSPIQGTCEGVNWEPYTEIQHGKAG